MKLLYKTSLINIILISILLLIAGAVLCSLLTNEFDEETVEKMYVNKERVVEVIKKGKQVESVPPVLEVQKLETHAENSLSVKDTFLFDPMDNDFELFKEVESVESINNQSYKITVRRIILEPEDYLNNIGIAIALVWVLLIIGYVIINWIISKRVWTPFYNNLERLRKFDIENEAPVNFHDSDITEFKELNNTLSKLTEKVRSDYNSLKEFSENAAHEMQTPLAIIQAKLEDAVQAPEMSEDQASQIKVALSAVHRLSKLNKSLLLLTKLENGQFDKSKKNNFIAEVEQVIMQFQDFIESKNISVIKNLEHCEINANPLLIEILLSNLIGNAIKYNVQDGEINIMLNQNNLTISNPSKEGVANPEILFGRFAKADQSSQSLGLGLTIVKKICNLHNWDITYSTNENKHILKIIF